MKINTDRYRQERQEALITQLTVDLIRAHEALKSSIQPRAHVPDECNTCEVCGFDLGEFGVRKHPINCIGVTAAELLREIDS